MSHSQPPSILPLPRLPALVTGQSLPAGSVRVAFEGKPASTQAIGDTTHNGCDAAQHRATEGEALHPVCDATPEM